MDNDYTHIKVSYRCRDSRLLVVGYYDGPVSGIITFEKISATFGFEALDLAPGIRYRLFMLFLLSNQEKQEFEREYDRDAPDCDLLDRIIRPRTKPDRLMMWDNRDNEVCEILDVPLAHEDVDWTPWMDQTADHDRFAVLGIALPEG
jgi:hypothetical protein